MCIYHYLCIIPSASVGVRCPYLRSIDNEIMLKKKKKNQVTALM